MTVGAMFAFANAPQKKCNIKGDFQEVKQVIEQVKQDG
jgi:hypothetical protein